MIRILFAILLCLPLFSAGKAKVRPLPVPDWAAEARPPTKAEIDTLRAERLAGECQNCLHIAEPAQYVDDAGKVWFVVAHPRIGMLAVRDNRNLLVEIGRCPMFADGNHDEEWVKAYLDKEIKGDMVRQWRESPAVYDGEELVTPAVGIIPDGWSPATQQAPELWR